MHRSTAFFLIVLRLVIGWHFLVEGWLKVESLYIVGPTITNKRFTSAGYFREAPGPLGQVIRDYSGDPNSDALDRLAVLPVPEGEDIAKDKPQKRVPPGLRTDWETYIKQFRKHYALDGEQDREVSARLDQHLEKVVRWLSYDAPSDPAARDKDPNYVANTTEQTRNYPSGEVTKRMTMAQRIAEYRTKLTESRNAMKSNWAFGRNVEKDTLMTLKAEVARLRSSLLSDLDEKTTEFKTNLAKILTKEQKSKGPVPPESKVGVIDYIDLVTPWMLLAIGACLFVGLFTRISAWCGAIFLLMTYLAIPAWPWLPAPPTSEGTYFFVNKNVVEMIALCVIATTDVGRWFGVDGIFYSIWGMLFAPKKKQNGSATSGS